MLLYYKMYTLATKWCFSTHCLTSVKEVLAMFIETGNYIASVPKTTTLPPFRPIIPTKTPILLFKTTFGEE